MDLSNLVEHQRILDQTICQNHNVTSQTTQNERILAFMVELGELANETRCFKYWSLKKASTKDIILEEYVDGIHFLVSLGIDLEFNAIGDVSNNDIDELSLKFIKVYHYAAQLSANFNIDNLKLLFNCYLQLGVMLGFQQEDIIKGYMLKNEENHQRQESGY